MLYSPGQKTAIKPFIEKRISEKMKMDFKKYQRKGSYFIPSKKIETTYQSFANSGAYARWLEKNRNQKEEKVELVGEKQEVKEELFDFIGEIKRPSLFSKIIDFFKKLVKPKVKLLTKGIEE